MSDTCSIPGYIRKRIRNLFTGQGEIVFHNKVPSQEDLEAKFRDIEELGIYLHIPFCNQICPYCPYNKEIYREETGRSYVRAIKHEIDTYEPVLKNKPVTSFYIGGGTPTTMIGGGIGEIINHVYKRFNMKCQVHMESHPNHLTPQNLDIITSLGVKYLSIGVEALQDRHLKAIERPYSAKEVKESVGRAVSRNFECVNIDLIFDLPGQTATEVEQAGRDMVHMGIHQAATYPLFRFPYTRFGGKDKENNHPVATMFRRRKYLKILEDIFYDSGFERTSVWAFTRQGTGKYCSVTVPLYLGLGASGSSYLKNLFYVNTFSVAEYIRAIDQGKSPVALSVELTEKMQMAGWLYWRIYETSFFKSDFRKRFGIDFDDKYGNYINVLKWLGFLQNTGDRISLSDKGAYWIHAFEDFFSINYISKLWGTSQFNPWPDEVVL